MKKMGYKFISIITSLLICIGVIPISTITSSAASTRYELVKTTSISKNEKYLIVYDNLYVLTNNNGTISSTPVSNYLVRKDLDESKLSNMLWTFSKSNNATLKNGDKYITRNKDGSLSLKSSSMTTFNIGSTDKEYQTLYNNSNYYINGDSNTFKATNSRYSSTYQKVTFYKLQEYGPRSSGETEITENVVHFPVTLYNYDGRSFNAETVKNNNNSTDNILSFTGTNSGNYASNSGVNAWSQATDNEIGQGIVNSSFNSDNNISFNNIAKNAGVFASSTPTVTGRDVYTNVEFPFLYDSKTGYYEFNSSQYHTHSNSLSNETLKLYKGKQELNNQGSFFPFNTDRVSKMDDIDYHFGMNMSVPFYMNTNGTIDGEELKTDGSNAMKFEFSGDDDVWVFINGKLVLDIGGIHNALGGSINFATGDVKYSKGDSDSNANFNIVDLTNNRKDITQTVQAKNLYKDFGITKESLQDGTNNLQIYYLERGSGKSNCRIKFNLIQKDTLQVSKELKQGTPSTTSKFKFKVEYKEKESDEFKPYEGQYDLFNGSQKDKTYTATGGIFSLSDDQKALFVKPPTGYYKVTELDSDNYETYWKVATKTITTTAENGSGTTNIGTKKDGKESQIIQITEAPEGVSQSSKYSLSCVNGSDFTLNDDTIVLDYGKSINYDVITNDNIDSSIEANLEAIGPGSATVDRSQLSNEYKQVKSDKTSDSVDLGNGSIKIKDEESVRYTLNKFMTSIDRAKYAVKYKTGDTYKYQYANITVIPATTIYYEDNFNSEGTDNKDSTVGIVYSGAWTEDKTSPGADDTQTGDDIYGADSSYDDDTKDSNGSSHVGINNDGKLDTATATFTFKGTGFDIISRTSTSSGAVLVQVYKGNTATGEVFDSKIVNTEYKSGLLYQIPVLTIKNLPYGEYTAKIIVSNKNTLTQNETFYLDAIRIYNPLGEDDDVPTDAQQAYNKDKEDNPIYIELRDKLIDQKSFDANKTSGNVVFVDQNGNADLDSYIKQGPNNEVYLANNQSISFKIDSTDYKKVLLGAKAPSGDAKIKVCGHEITLTSATDMYKDITEYIKDAENGVITITSTGSNIASLTNLKITGSTKAPSIYVTGDMLNNKAENIQLIGAKFTTKAVKLNTNATLKVTANTNVDKVQVLNSKNKVVAESSKYETVKGNRVFTLSVKQTSIGTSAYKVIGMNGDNKVSNNTIDVSIAVKRTQFEVIFAQLRG